MEVIDKLKADRSFLDRVIQELSSKTVTDIFFDVFIFFENECFLDEDAMPNHLKNVATEFWELTETEETVSVEWLRTNLEITPYFEDITIDSWFINYYMSDEQPPREEIIELMNPFIEFKDFETKTFLEKLYYEDFRLFVLLCWHYGFYIKSFERSAHSLDEDEEIIDDFDEEVNSIIYAFRTYNMVYIIDKGGDIVEWFEISEFNLEPHKLHSDFSEAIKPQSVFRDNNVKQTEVSSEQILEWLYSK